MQTLNIKQFIEKIIKFDNVEDILSKCKNTSEKGLIFEKLFDVVIKFGFCDIFPNTEYIHLIGNVNNAELKPLININDYLTSNVSTSNSSGCSDITLKHNDNNYVFISSKYFEDDSKKLCDDYDIQNIIAATSNYKHIYQNYEIYNVVSDKTKVLNVINNANKSSNYITKHMNENTILDKKDLNKYFL
jgi:hypothetical protein